MAIRNSTFKNLQATNAVVLKEKEKMSSQHTCTQQIQCLKKQKHMCTTNMLLLHTTTSAHHVNWGIMCLSDKQQLQHPYPWDGINSGLSTCTSIKYGHIFVFIMFWVMDPWSHETLQASMTAVMFVSMANAGQCLWYSVITSLTSLQASLKGMHAVCAPASCSQSVGKLLPSIQWQSVSNHLAEARSAWLLWSVRSHFTRGLFFTSNSAENALTACPECYLVWQLLK